ncbi:MAG: cryptochrome/photolyase family protein [Tepidimonas sp.]|uniref:cryptochrome/photolyase family protein n=1 Tax=Tepidimonas sp. TaxID=2002775 RepID=UPI00298F2E17|nr:cryptochrome/photolyase family protein [Tepidimonas sp.]MDW8336112.1 cryptochrome/photolyase family protein [Tepidimonas sp.]
MNPCEPTPPPRTPTRVLRLLLGDQLNPLHPWLREVRPDVLYVLMEVRSETDVVDHHAQKVLAIFAAMRALAAQLRARGHRVRYLPLDHPHNRQSIPANLQALLQAHGAEAVELQQPDEWRLDDELRRWAAQAGVPVRIVDSGHFLLPRDGVAQLLGRQRRWVMEHLYRHVRRQYRVLMDGDRPLGGRWNFDADNRSPWRGQPPEPADPRPRHDVRALWQLLQTHGVVTVGHPQADALPWPLTRAQALTQLDAFIEHSLPHFGPYQDALAQGHPRLFHSQLSWALNVKLLHPLEVVRRAEAAYHAGAAPLASVEGFIRQILGWREYVRGVYWTHMPGYTTRNALGHTRALPRWYWDGQTDMACLRAAIGQTLQHAYAHHIQRLMVTGNFALLAGCDPAQVHRWYLGVYIDAFEWVEAPNTLGMSQWADGGLMATKPYAASAAYLKRMGDHCHHCRYDPRQRIGPQACPFNALYWDFIARHQDSFAAHPRIGMMVRQWQRIAANEQRAVRQWAQTLLMRVDEL